MNNTISMDAIRVARFGLSLLGRGKLQSAEACGLMAVTMAPDEALGYWLVACACARRGKTAHAIAAYARLIALEPANVRAHVDAAELRLNVGDFGEACALLTAAMTLDPHAKTPAGVRARVMVVRTFLSLES